MNLTESQQKKNDWLNTKWRPMMGWTYMITCITDFILFPILWSLIQALAQGQVSMQWQPITLQGAGLFHIAMGTVLGITAYGRTKEKLDGVASGIPYDSTYVPPPFADTFEDSEKNKNTYISKTGKAGPIPPAHPEI
jgi:hypothetical protein